MEQLSDLKDDLSVTSNILYRTIAQDLVNKCGVRADLKGCRCLIDAVIIYGTRPPRGFCKLYEAVAAINGLKTKTVMREISYAISQSFSVARNLSELVGIKIPAADIHSSLVIAYLGSLLRQQLDLARATKEA